MPYLIAGLVLFWFALPTLRAVTRVPPALAAQLIRAAAGVGCFGVALLLALRGGLEFAAVAAVAGLWLIGRSRSGPRSVAGRPAGPAGRGRPASRVRSAMIEMELDRATGALRGLVLAGSFQDRNLDSLDARECAALLAECRAHDPDGGRLLEAYLDRRFPGRRATEQDGVDPRRDSPWQHSGDWSATTGPMTDNEAYEVLGLRRGATRDEIARAHRALMKKLHPDQGGSTQLAARVNEAKDILLRRHS